MARAGLTAAAGRPLALLSRRRNIALAGALAVSMGLIRLLLTSRRTMSRAWRLARDERVPMRLKVMALIGVLLILSPLNLLGDIPILGFFDDAALLAFLLGWFVRVAGPYGIDDLIQTAG